MNKKNSERYVHVQCTYYALPMMMEENLDINKIIKNNDGIYNLHRESGEGKKNRKDSSQSFL